MEKEEAITNLRKNSIDVDVDDRIISLQSDTKIGNKVWSYIDCLVNYHGFILTRHGVGGKRAKYKKGALR